MISQPQDSHKTRADSGRWTDGQTDYPLHIPEIFGERCVHAITEQSSCRACVDSCPPGAWLLDDDGLDLDTQACDGCGLCAPACPQGAIQQPREVLHGEWRGRQVAAVACERSGVRSGAGMLPCLHTLGERELLRLHRAGVTHIISCSGDCSRCERNNGGTLEQHLSRVNQVLLPRKQGRLSHVGTDRAKWQRLADRLTLAEADGPSLSRRAFFSASVKTSARLLGLHADEQQLFQAPGELLGQTRPGLPLPYVPQIDQQRCNACNACARLCPQGAIKLVRDAAGDAYQLQPTLCTGCRICSDSCDRDAIQIKSGVVPPADRIALTSAHCASCGVPFLYPGDVTERQSLCVICRRTDHQRRLFQVY